MQYTYAAEQSFHYIEQLPIEGLDPPAHNTPFGNFQNIFPDYGNFLKDKNIVRKVYSLFREDFTLYERACSQQWLLDDCDKCKKVCDEYKNIFLKYGI